MFLQNIISWDFFGPAQKFGYFQTLWISIEKPVEAHWAKSSAMRFKISNDEIKLIHETDPTVTAGSDR